MVELSNQVAGAHTLEQDNTLVVVDILVVDNLEEEPHRQEEGKLHKRQRKDRLGVDIRQVADNSDLVVGSQGKHCLVEGSLHQEGGTLPLVAGSQLVEQHLVAEHQGGGPVEGDMCHVVYSNHSTLHTDHQAVVALQQVVGLHFLAACHKDHVEAVLHKLLPVHMESSSDRPVGPSTGHMEAGLQEVDTWP